MRRKKADTPEVNLSRLTTAMRRSRLALRQYRQERLIAVKQYVGTHWSEESVRETVPLNLIYLYCQIVLRNLISHNPAVMLSTFDRSMKPTVAAMEDWANREIKRTNLAETLKRVALDALFTVGVLKVAIATPADANASGWNLPAGQPFAEPVDFDDFVFDVHAQRWEEVSYIGHRLRVPLASVQDNPMYGPAKVRDRLSGDQDRLYNQEGDERINSFGRTALSGSMEEFIEFIDLWEVYLPHTRQVVTLTDDQMHGGFGSGEDDNSGKPLHVVEWLGPDCGPYHVLAFNVVPGNIMPIAPVMQLIDLHEAVNNMLRKLIRQGQRQKQITLVVGGQSEDGERVMRANDGEMLSVTNPESTKTVAFGGPDPQLFALMQSLQQMFSWAAGNLDSMGGLSPQAKTASQDQMLAQNSQRGIADMQDAVVTFTAGALEHLLWYWWHHPTNVLKVEYTVPGLPGVSTLRQVPPEKRNRPFSDLMIQVDPYSLKHSSPESQMAAINQVVTQIVIPMQPLLQAQGIQFDINAFLAQIAKFLNIPDLNNILSIGEPPQTEGQPAPAASSGTPAQTTRTYVRENMPGRTPQGDAKDNIARALGQDKGGDPAKYNQPSINGVK